MNNSLRCEQSFFSGIICFLLVLISPAVCLSQTSPPEPDITELEFDRSFSRTLTGGETHYYKISMRAGEYVHVAVQQQGIDVVLTVFDSDHRELRKIDRPNGAYGREGLSLIADTEQKYQLRIQSLAPTANGTYSIKLDVRRSALPRDTTMLLAEGEISKAEKSRSPETPRGLQRALEQFKDALTRWRGLNDRYEEAVALYGLALTYRLLNEYQKSVSTSLEGLSVIRELKDENLEAALLTNLGWAYVYLGDSPQVFDSISRALVLRRRTGDKAGEALTLYGLGWFYALTDQNDKALEVFNETLALRRQAKNRTGEGLTLIGIAKILHRLGKNNESVAYLDEAVKILRPGKKNFLAEALSSLGWVEHAMTQDENALVHFKEALALWQEVEDRTGEATTRYGMARTEARFGRLSEAQQHMQIALEYVEAMRARGENQRLRTSYFSMVEDYYEFDIGLLMRLHKENPSKGYASEAFRVSERSRNRNLLDLLNEASVDIRQGVDATLLEQERLLHQQLDEAAEKRRATSASAGTIEDKVLIAQEISSVSAKLQDVSAQIRKVSPHYALLTQARPVSAGDVQQSLLDSDTMLLEYALGTERSYLWAITKDELLSYELPRRAEIEALAKTLYKLMTARNEDLNGETAAQKQARIIRADADYDGVALRFSQTLLGPVAHKLGKNRLVIVAPALLQVIPFAALPTPASVNTNASSEPLLEKHEIVNSPSASVLAVLRQRVRDLPQRTIAIVADPVFARNDERFASSSGNGGRRVVAHASEMRVVPAGQSTASASVEKSLPRLFNTRWEANTIASFVPKTQRIVALDFSANRAFVNTRQFARSWALHFATHTLINDEHSELSGIALSNFDSQGRKQDGFLRTHEIYRLRLLADLVVLSSCQSALGEQVKGEGLVGLTHGFMYAGVPRVVASLWTVSDNPTAQLMAQFYREMLKHGTSPAAALRSAQLSMLKDKRWQAPYFWSGFVLQGEWR